MLVPAVNLQGEGTFSEVLAAQNIKVRVASTLPGAVGCVFRSRHCRPTITALCLHRGCTQRPRFVQSGELAAIKCMKQTFTSIEQVNSLREIQALRRLSPHPNIVKLHEVLYDKPTGRLALVFELLSFNMYELIRGRCVDCMQLKIARAGASAHKSVVGTPPRASHNSCNRATGCRAVRRQAAPQRDALPARRLEPAQTVAGLRTRQLAVMPQPIACGDQRARSRRISC